MPQLHETLLGRAFFDHHFPKLGKNVERLCNVLQESNEIAAQANLIAIEANELKKRELDLLERKFNDKAASYMERMD